jgi:hypothetical protein
MEIQKQIDGISEMDYEEELFRVVTHSSDEDEVLDMLNEN